MSKTYLNPDTPVPVRNLYYLLCYAWDYLPARAFAPVAAEATLPLPYLLVHVLLAGLQQLLKKGLHQGYVPQFETLAGLRGRVLLTPSLRQLQLPRGRAVCRFEALSPDVPINQLLKTTVGQMLALPDLPRPLCTGLAGIAARLREISEKPIDASDFRKITPPDGLYRLLLNVSKLWHENLLPGPAGSAFLFQDFTRDPGRMAALFEAFVRNFYRHELPSWRVGRENIQWQFEATATDHALLPRMQTDISLQGPDRHLMIDTKFYAEMFQQHFGVPKIRSAHLYQLFAYLKNRPSKGPVEAILLYPVVRQEHSARFSQGQQSIRIETLDLAADWSQIHRQLLKLVE